MLYSEPPQTPFFTDPETPGFVEALSVERARLESPCHDSSGHHSFASELFSLKISPFDRTSQNAPTFYSKDTPHCKLDPLTCGLSVTARHLALGCLIVLALSRVPYNRAIVNLRLNSLRR